MNKRAFWSPGILFWIFAFLIVVGGVLALAGFFSDELQTSVGTISGFLREFGIWILVAGAVLAFRNEIIGILRFLFGKVGVRI